MKSSFTPKRLAFLGMMTALVFASNYLRIVMPVPVGGVPSFTLANIFCVLSGLLLGPVGGLAAGLGSALYDLTNPLWASEAWITFLTKGTMGLMAGTAVVLGRRGELSDAGYPRYLTAAVIGCVSYYVLYFLKGYYYNGILLGGLSAGAALLTLPALIPPSLFNGGVAIAIAPPLASAIQTGLKKSGLSLQKN